MIHSVEPRLQTDQQKSNPETRRIDASLWDLWTAVAARGGAVIVIAT